MTDSALYTKINSLPEDLKMELNDFVDFLIAKKNDEVSEPLSEYQQPLDFDQVWKMFQETDKQFKETDKKFQETDRKLKRLSEIASGLGINLGEVAEDFFRGALENRNELWGFPYSHVDSLKRTTKQKQGQYDIVLFNEETIMVIEVKQKLHPNDVDVFYNRKLPEFKNLFPEYKDKNLIGAVASFTIPDDSKEKAISYGFLVLAQTDQKIKVLNDSQFKPQLFN